MSHIEKRKRSPNWLASEKHLLLDIVEKHFSVIENKKTDAVTMKQKTTEWVTMSHEYNSQTIQCSRTAENLKAQWESMKKAVKKETSNIRMHMIQTGMVISNVCVYIIYYIFTFTSLLFVLHHCTK